MGIVDDVRVAADWMAAGLVASGYAADYSTASAGEIDRLFADQMIAPGKPKPHGLLATDLGARIFGIGSYVGEVIRRNGEGWSWAGDDGDPSAETNVELRRGRDERIWPVQRVMKRYAEGPESGIGAYAHVLLEPDSPPS